MPRLPASLDRRLRKLFPRVREREEFVAEVVEEALNHMEKEEQALPKAVGGSLHLFTDGGSRGNPGEAAVGCVLLDPSNGNVIDVYKEAIGIHTNNEAEYIALIRGLELVRDYRPNHLVVHMDSELVVKQMTGEYRVRMPTLQPLIEAAHSIAGELPDVSYCHVSRERNTHADRLVNEALNEAEA